MPQFYTQPGVAGYCHLTKPDTKYNKDGEYHVEHRLLRKDPKTRELLQIIKDEFIKAYSEEDFKKASAMMKKKEKLKAEGDKSMNKVGTGLPYRFPHDDDETVIIKAKTYNRPKYGDSNGNTIDPNKGQKIPQILSGSKLRIIVTIKSQTGHTGVSLWLNTVQIIELAKGMDMEASEDTEGGGYVMESANNGMSSLQNETSERVGAGQVADENEELVDSGEEDDDDDF